MGDRELHTRNLQICNSGGHNVTSASMAVAVSLGNIGAADDCRNRMYCMVMVKPVALRGVSCSQLCASADDGNGVPRYYGG